MKIETKFNLEQIVALKTDPQKLERMIVGIKINPDMNPLYYLNQSTVESTHYECEIQEIDNSRKAGFKK